MESDSLSKKNIGNSCFVFDWIFFLYIVRWRSRRFLFKHTYSSSTIHVEMSFDRSNSLHFSFLIRKTRVYVKDSESTAYESNRILLPAGNNSISLVFLSQFPRAATKEKKKKKKKKLRKSELRLKAARRNPIKNASPLSTKLRFLYK